MCGVVKILHSLWAFSVVVRLVRGNGCVVWLKYLSVLTILNKFYIPEFVDGWMFGQLLCRSCVMLWIVLCE